MILDGLSLMQLKASTTGPCGTEFMASYSFIAGSMRLKVSCIASAPSACLNVKDPCGGLWTQWKVLKLLMWKKTKVPEVHDRSLLACLLVGLKSPVLVL